MMCVYTHMDAEEYLHYKPPHALCMCMMPDTLVLALSYLTSTVSVTLSSHTP
jgi:hypothetical protein